MKADELGEEIAVGRGSRQDTGRVFAVHSKRLRLPGDPRELEQQKFERSSMLHPPQLEQLELDRAPSTWNH